MASTFTVQIASPERVCLEREVASLTAPAYDGYLGVMANHAPMVAELRVGEVRLVDADGAEELVAVSGGFLSVSDNTAVVLADSAEVATDIDQERAQEAKKRARERLAGNGDNQDSDAVDSERARCALVRAINRLTVVGKRP
ncbi:MAG TPA: ATP synthase F1 subunit epsilon [Armatimonadota bacterium]|jgi:F-type H+-transporting ATPase subunit epsilon|nr:ATP synthase F1 subunit epsilon [Armatimonadota bacterium]